MMAKGYNPAKVKAALEAKEAVVEALGAAAERRAADRARAKKSDLAYGRAWAQALGEGWSREQLKKAGFEEPTAMPPRRNSTRQMKSQPPVREFQEPAGDVGVVEATGTAPQPAAAQ